MSGSLDLIREAWANTRKVAAEIERSREATGDAA
jgi:hypothetical protein